MKKISDETRSVSGGQNENDSDGGNSQRVTRRAYLGAVGLVLTTGLAGCSGGESESQSGDGGSTSGGGSNATPSAENERQAEEADEENGSDSGSSDVNPADVPQGENLLEYNGLVLNEHESQPYESLGWFSVVGIVENTTGETVDYTEVKVRAYDGDGNQIESVFTNTTDLQAGGTWKFEVTATSDFEEVDEYDIRISDSPF